MTTKSAIGAIAQRIKQADHTVAELTGRVTVQAREIRAQRQQIERLKALLVQSGVRIPRDIAVPPATGGAPAGRTAP